MINASGRASITAAAVVFTRDSNIGIFGNTSNNPITDRSDISNKLLMPAACIIGPPTPENETFSDACAFRPSIKAAPNLSPDISPAIKNNFKSLI